MKSLSWTQLLPRYPHCDTIEHTVASNGLNWSGAPTLSNLQN